MSQRQVTALIISIVTAALLIAGAVVFAQQDLRRVASDELFAVMVGNSGYYVTKFHDGDNLCYVVEKPSSNSVGLSCMRD